MTNPTGGLPAIAGIVPRSLLDGEQIALASGLTAVMFREPGRTLNISTHRRIYQALVPVTSSSFGADTSRYWAQRSREGYLERLAELVLVADPRGAFVGWTGFHVLHHDEHTIVYLDSTGVVPQWQSKGVMRDLMYRRIAESALPACTSDRPAFLTARSENPVFYRLVRGLVDRDRLFPHPSDPVPAQVGLCGQHLADWLGQRELLDPATLILRNAYGDTFDQVYGELPSTGEPELDKLFHSELGPLDAYLIIGQVH